jgi:hypothetical protein
LSRSPHILGDELSSASFTIRATTRPCEELPVKLLSQIATVALVAFVSTTINLIPPL